MKNRLYGLLTTGWSFSRLLRFAMGVVVLVFALRNHDWLLGLGGGLLFLMGFFNIGCAGASCHVPTNKAGTK